MLRSLLVSAVGVAGLLPGLAAAQTVLNGALSDATTGPLLSGVVYHATGSISVNAGATLTIQPGAIVKLGNGQNFQISGTVLANGTSGQPIYITSLSDDTAGGDTNGDGPSSGSPGQWVFTRFFAGSDASVFKHVIVRFGGAGGWNPIRLDNSAATFEACTVEHNSGPGFELTNSAARPTIAGCTIRNNTGWAISGARFDTLANLSNNRATGNGGNAVLVSTSTVQADASIVATNGINGVLALQGGLNLPAGRTLDVGPGVILKLFPGGTSEIVGTLNTQGSSSRPVIFTSIFDDSVGGDSNGDGASSALPGQWVYTRFYASSSASQLVRTHFRFGGAGGWTPVRIEDASPGFQNCTVSSSAGDALFITSPNGRPTLQACKFENNAGWAIVAQGFESLANVSGSIATGNSTNAVRVQNGGLASDTVLRPAAGINGVIVASSIGIPAGRTLTIEAGTILKLFPGATIEVPGTLLSNGTPTQPVVITSFFDDVYGGDTNTDGPSNGTPGQWVYTRFYASASSSLLFNTIFRFGGAGGWTPVRFDGASPTLARCTIENAALHGISYAGSASQARLDQCIVRGNAGYAITDVQLESVPYITRLQATGNGQDQVRVTSANLASDVYLDGNSGLNGVVVCATSPVVSSGTKLTLGPGAILKFTLGQNLQVSGSLVVAATGDRPAILTSEFDDAAGGDSNGPAGGPNANQWTFLTIHSTSPATDVEHLIVRYAGAGGWHALRCLAPTARLRHVDVNQSGNGFELQAFASADYLTAWNISAGTGFSLTGGNVDVERASANGCNVGFARGGSFTGLVTSSISWGNSTNAQGFLANQAIYSDGFGAGLGNLNVDPMFLQTFPGDLRLAPGSPCVDAGDPALAKDADCTRADMGSAFPEDSPDFYCTAKVNSFGCSPFLGVTGFTRTQSSEPLRVRAFNVLNNKVGLFFYGTSGRQAHPFQGGFKCVLDPIRRTATSLSGGVSGFANCTGVLTLDVTALAASGSHPTLVGGATVQVQSWYRDPAAVAGSGLSNAVEFTLCQ